MIRLLTRRARVSKITRLVSIHTRQSNITNNRPTIRTYLITQGKEGSLRASFAAKTVSIDPIIQQDQTGCGIACLAALAKQPYKQVKELACALEIDVADVALWSTTTPVRRLAQALGVVLADDERSFVSWDALPDVALLAIKYKQKSGVAYWHWIVFCRRGQQTYVLDSNARLRHNRRTDFGRIKPKWYIQVSL